MYTAKNIVPTEGYVFPIAHTVIFTSRGRSIRITYIDQIDLFAVNYKLLYYDNVTNNPKVRHTSFYLSKEAANATRWMLQYLIDVNDVDLSNQDEKLPLNKSTQKRGRVAAIVKDEGILGMLWNKATMHGRTKVDEDV